MSQFPFNLTRPALAAKDPVTVSKKNKESCCVFARRHQRCMKHTHTNHPTGKHTQSKYPQFYYLGVLLADNKLVRFPVNTMSVRVPSQRGGEWRGQRRAVLCVARRSLADSTLLRCAVVRTAPGLFDSAAERPCTLS